jgi:hypothetical protein
MNLSKVSHLPLAAFLAAVIMLGMPALARLQPKPADDPWLKLRPPLHPVAGTLLHDGKPVVGAVVTFVAQTEEEENSQFTAVSATDKDGRFWLRTFSSRGDGAVAGRHSIKVERMVPTGRMLAGSGLHSALDLGTIPPWLDSVIESGNESAQMDSASMDPFMGCSAFPGIPEMINVLPSRFADERTSGLTAEVTAEGPNEFLIQLSSEPPPAADYEAASETSSETSFWFNARMKNSRTEG